MKVVQITRRLVVGGRTEVERMAWHNAQQLHHLGHTCTLATTAALAPEGLELVGDVTIRRFPYQYPRLFLSARAAHHMDHSGGDPIAPALFEWLRRADVDVIHCHAMHRLARSARDVARERGIPFVVSLHYEHLHPPDPANLEPLLHGSFDYGHLLDQVRGRRRVLRDADGILCFGEREATLLQQLYPRKAVRYMPAGIDPVRWRMGDGQAVRQRLGIPVGDKVMLCLARYEPTRQQDLLLQLMAQAPADWHLVMVGPVFSLPWLNELQQTIRRESLARIHVLQGIPDYLRDLLHASDVLVLPYTAIPRRLPFLEAWAAHKPVIATDSPWFRTHLADGQTGLLFQPGDVEHLRRCLADAFYQPQLREALTRTAFQELHQTYSWRAIGEELAAFYEALVSEY